MSVNQTTAPTPQDIPPEISELNEILAKMISGQNLGEELNKCCLKIQEKTRSLLVAHSRKEKERIEEMERQKCLQKQTYDQRINFILDSCQLVAGNSLARTFPLAYNNQPVHPVMVPTVETTRPEIFLGAASDQQSNTTRGNLTDVSNARDPTPIPVALAEPEAVEESVAPTPSTSSTSRKATKPTKAKKSVSKRVITRLPKEKHGFHMARIQKGFFCLCGQELSSKCNLRRHIKLHTQKEKLFSCDSCTKCFVSLNLLKKHQKDIHKMQDLDKGTIGCSDCGKIFANHLLHRKHRRMCHNVGKKSKSKK